jgi:hypothetical protein
MAAIPQPNAAETFRDPQAANELQAAPVALGSSKCYTVLAEMAALSLEWIQRGL